MNEKKYQVFISSTYKDLMEEREAAIKTILNLNHIPIGMEMFNAGDDEQWSVIKRTIDTSDYYVVIIGLCYGSVTEDGISFTEKEYDYAVSKGIPVLTFIRDENAPSIPQQREPDPKKRKKLDAFREKAKKKIAKFWTTKDEFTTMLSTSLYSEMKQNPRIGWIQATVDPYAINQEIIELTRENRELRKCIENIETRKPKLIFDLENDDNFKFHFVPSKMLLREELNYEHIPDAARGIVTFEDVKGYNEALPSQEEYDDYNEKCSRYINMTENKHKVCIRIKNNGNISANQVTLKLHFPPEILVFDDYDVEKVETPKGLDIPKNPMHKYYHMNKEKQKITTYAQPSFHLSAPRISAATSRMIAGYSNNYYTIDEDYLCCEIDNLLHKNVQCSNDFYIVATKRGTYEIECSIICEEYSEPENKTFVVTIV